MKKFKKVAARVAIFLIALYLVLLIPDGKKKTPVVREGQTAFTWNRDSVWEKLENDFAAAKELSDSQLYKITSTGEKKILKNIFDLISKSVAVGDSNLINAQQTFFNLAPFVAALKSPALKSSAFHSYVSNYNALRQNIKTASQGWNMQETASRDYLYSLLYGMRAAVEEVILQSDTSLLSPVMLAKDERSVTPAAKIFGIGVHSGDILVSRGGAEVSALISRGNDYPGNFSHIALLYVDEKTSNPYLIEAHIEKGVAIASVDEYEKDKKLRFMVMRPRADLPVMKANPMLPHIAAKAMYNESLSRHIPYDFKMNYKDSIAMFCSEVASYTYLKNGLQLWPSLSTISSVGVVNWLNDFGVENFITQMPADLEYDPQLSVVAEWRDPEMLFKDHVDNAIMDALLEQANKGVMVGYDHWKLPFVRMLKGYCMIKNLFGKQGIIPEGMSATTALKNERLVAMYKNIKAQVLEKTTAFQQKNNYRPPYWQLVKFAREATAY